MALPLNRLKTLKLPSAGPLRQLHAFAHPQVESRVSVFEQRLRGDQRYGGGRRTHGSRPARRQVVAERRGDDRVGAA